MNKEILESAGIDYEEGMRRFSGVARLYEKYLKKLLTDSTYGEMRSAALEGNIQGAFEAAHKMKAFAGNLSITQFYEEIRALTEEFRAGVSRDYGPDFEKLDGEYQQILEAIRNSVEA